MSWRWLGACAFGEAIAIAGVAIIYAATDRAALPAPVVWILVAGAWEGACLGAAQAWFLGQRGIEPKRWIVMTAFGAALGYALSFIGRAGVAGDPQADPALWVVLLGGGLVGVVMGPLLSGVQLLAAGGRMKPVDWVLGNTIGWIPAMAIILLAATTAGADWPIAVVALWGAGAGALAGLSVGVATRFALPPAAPST